MTNVLIILCVLENEVTENLAKTVVKVMQKCKGIQCFSLKKAFIGEEGVAMICRAMKSLNKSRSRSRSHSQSSATDQRHFVSCLRVTSDPLDSAACSPLASLLALPPPCCRLTRLDVSDNLLGDEGCVLLASALRHNPRSTLTALDLSSNLLADEGMEALSDLLREQEEHGGEPGTGTGTGAGAALRSLAVNRNMFGDSPLMFLSDALKSNQTLESLE